MIFSKLLKLTDLPITKRESIIIIYYKKDVRKRDVLSPLPLHCITQRMQKESNSDNENESNEKLESSSNIEIEGR